MKNGNKIAMIVVLLLVVIFGVGQFFAGSVTPNPGSSANNQATGTQTSAAPITQVIAYVPTVTSSTPVESGSCWTNSIAAAFRSDAWRCSVGNSIDDPCFQIPNSKNLLCGVNPQKPGSEFVLKLTKPLPPSSVPPGSNPINWGWLVQLQDGTLCSPFTGTMPYAADGESAPYGCAPGPLGKDIMIFGDLNASSSVWTAKIGSLSDSTSTFPPVLENAQTVNIAKVWQ